MNYDITDDVIMRGRNSREGLSSESLTLCCVDMPLPPLLGLDRAPKHDGQCGLRTLNCSEAMVTFKWRANTCTLGFRVANPRGITTTCMHAPRGATSCKRDLIEPMAIKVMTSAQPSRVIWDEENGKR